MTAILILSRCVRKWGQKLSAKAKNRFGWWWLRGADRRPATGTICRGMCCVSHVYAAASRGEPLFRNAVLSSRRVRGTMAHSLALAVRTVQNQGMCYNLGMAGDSAVQDIKEDGRTHSLSLSLLLTESQNKLLHPCN